jgi:hypothetical protein
MLRRIRVPSPAMVVALLALFLNLAGVAYAATGGNLILGSSNSAGKRTSLSASIADRSLQLTNTSASAGASALGLTVAKGHAPLVVSSGAAKVANLNADTLDGFDSTALRGYVVDAFSTYGAAPSANYMDGFTTTTSGDMLFQVDGSAYSATAGARIGETLILCTSAPCTSSNIYLSGPRAVGFADQASAHTALVPGVEEAFLAAGTYYLNIIPDPGTLTDNNSALSWLVVNPS